MGDVAKRRANAVRNEGAKTLNAHMSHKWPDFLEIKCVTVEVQVALRY